MSRTFCFLFYKVKQTVKSALKKAVVVLSNLGSLESLSTGKLSSK